MQQATMCASHHSIPSSSMSDHWHLSQWYTPQCIHQHGFPLEIANLRTQYEITWAKYYSVNLAAHGLCNHNLQQLAWSMEECYALLYMF